MSDACKSRFTTWINQKCGGAILGEVVVAEDYDALIAINADLLEALQEVMSCCGPRELNDIFGYEWYRNATAAISKATINQ